jgi:hypothetical protein
MVDPGIKKSIVLNSELPSINSELNGYEVRYRVISEDKNRTSHWSPVYLVLPNFTYQPGAISFNKNGSIASFSWDNVPIYKDSVYIRQAHEYDIWVQWDKNDGGDWSYKQRIDGTSISFPIPDTYTINGVVQSSQPNQVSLEVYLKGSPITRDFSNLLVYQSGPHTI